MQVAKTVRVILGLCLALLGPARLHGDVVAFPGGQLDVPDPVSAATARGARTRAPGLDGSWTYSGAWSCDRARWTLHVGVHAGSTEIHPSKIALVERSVEAALRGASARLSTVGVVELPAGNAYRVECRSGSSTRALRQVQFIVSGRDTVVLTFSGQGDGLRAMESAIAEAVATLRLDRKAGLLDRAPAWLCGSCLGLLAAAILLGRWGKAHLAHEPFGLPRSSESLHSKRSGV